MGVRFGVLLKAMRYSETFDWLALDDLVGVLYMDSMDSISSEMEIFPRSSSNSLLLQ